MSRNNRILCSAVTCLFLVFTFLFYVSAQEENGYDAKGLRNPFVALVTPDGRLIQLETKESRTESIIEGIIFDDFGVSYAIINGAIVRVGDFVEDKQVLKIEKERVFFVKEGQVSVMELKKEE